MGPVLELIDSYETRIATVEELMTTAYQATVTSSRSFDILDEERERLKIGLQKTLARNCSLRKKDFNLMLEKLLSNSDRSRAAIEEDRNRVREKVNEYLDEHKQLAKSLRQQLDELARENTGDGCLDMIVKNIKVMYEENGKRLFTVLREFQSRLEAYRREQVEINHKLQRLADRGESLNFEDFRQLEASGTILERARDREQRREEVDSLLSHFRQQRLETHRH